MAQPQGQAHVAQLGERFRRMNSQTQPASSLRSGDTQAVWLEEKNSGCWVAGSLLDAGDDATSTVSVFIEEDGSVAHVAPSQVQPRNAEDSSEAADLSTLAHLNEPCILQALALRHSHDEIYTKVGAILIAVNPWRRLPQLTSDDMLRSYMDVASVNDTLAPHPFAVARASYAGVLRGERQSVLVSGESGAGKTETTKILLQYLAASSGAGVGGVEAVLLEANPILESFGNAKTSRNHNSSRFGKWVDIRFDKAGAICGGAVRTYLLEKSRATAVPAGERSFHVYYQLLARPNGALYRAASVPLPTIDGCHYLSHGSGTESAPCLLAPGIDDAAHGEALEAALAAVGLSTADDMKQISKGLTACLLLGNVAFADDGSGTQGEEPQNANDGTACVVCSSQAALETVATALSVPPASLATALTERSMTLRGETVRSPRTPAQANDARDALAKAVFDGLFRHVVLAINKQLQPSPGGSDGAQSEGDAGAVGVLDIFGFESFKQNGFEQLCINFANEKLQGQFNAVIFEMQRQEYEMEGLTWRGGSFTSNAPTLQLLESKSNPPGIFSLLHEQCRLPRGDDAKYVEAVRSTHKSHPSLVAPRLPRDVFGIRHYAGTVTYGGAGFVHKNRDALPDELLCLLTGSSCPFTCKLLTGDGGGSGGGSRSVGGGSAPGGASLGLQFKSQLTALLGEIALGHSHYVRCVTPNHTKEPGVYDRPTMLHQLRCSGLMDAVRVAREGYPTRLLHAVFIHRYRCLVPGLVVSAPRCVDAVAGSNDANESDLRCLTETMIGCIREHNALRDSLVGDTIAMGLTKVFLQLTPFHMLESVRVATIAAAATRVQTASRCRAAFTLRCRALASAGYIQRVARGAAARTMRHIMRRERASTVLQTAALVMVKRRRQAAVRRSQAASSRLGAAWRQCRHRRAFQNHRRAVIIVQSAGRRRAACVVLRSRRAAARDVCILRQENERLKELLRLATQSVAVSEANSNGNAAHEAVQATPPAPEGDDEVISLREALAKRTADVQRLQSQLEAQTAVECPLSAPCTINAAEVPTMKQLAKTTAHPKPSENGVEIHVSLARGPRQRATWAVDQGDKENESVHQEDAQCMSQLPVGPSVLSRALTAEAEVIQLRNELQILHSELQSNQHDGDTLPLVTTGIADVTAPLATVEQQPAEPEVSSLEAELAAAKDELEKCTRRLSRQEKIVAKLMKELREEKTKHEIDQTSGRALERLQADLHLLTTTVVARMQSLETSLPESLVPAADRLAGAVATDASDTNAIAQELEAAASAARLETVAAEEAREHSEARADGLQQRVAAQTNLIANLLRRNDWVAEGQGDASEGVALANVADGKGGDTEGMLTKGSPMGKGLRLASAFSPSAAMGALTHTVKCVASAAAGLYSPINDHGAQLGGCSNVYVGLLEEELTRMLERLEAQCEVSRQLSHEVAVRDCCPVLSESPTLSRLGADGPGADSSTGGCAPLSTALDHSQHEPTAEHAAALAAAEAAADALIFADQADGSSTDGSGVDGAPPANEPSPTDSAYWALEAVKERAAAAALLEELRQENAKSTRLERIISKLMMELRQTKVQLASGGIEAGQLALEAFHSDVARVEKALHQIQQVGEALVLRLDQLSPLIAAGAPST